MEIDGTGMTRRSDDEREILPGLTLRRANSDDTERLIQLVSLCFEEYADRGVVLELDGLDRDLKHWSDSMESQRGEGWVVDSTVESCIAMIGFTALDDSLFEVKRVYVHPGHRGTRLAVRMLSFIEKRVMARGGSILMCWSDSRFARAHSFYRREGFARLPDSRFLNDPSNTEEYQFVKAL